MLKFIDFETGVRAIRFISESPLFKGSALIVLALIAFLSAVLMAKSGRKKDLNFWVFVAVASIILIYGTYILVMRPQWWQPPA